MRDCKIASSVLSAEFICPGLAPVSRTMSVPSMMLDSHSTELSDNIIDYLNIGVEGAKQVLRSATALLVGQAIKAVQFVASKKSLGVLCWPACPVFAMQEKNCCEYREIDVDDRAGKDSPITPSALNQKWP